ncbi:18116_t:CDS:2 [Gigaspora margarita]|uniref:18116_t:CDS:1 n=1 Tax=Gigaspora margarita TaxID=4874 RepID=A0ABN7VEP9_GIGMA|nr:18116_t:CDS:2 [Gigaspora margarita]
MFPNFNISDVFLFALLIILALIYDSLRQTNLKIDMIQIDLSENTKYFYFVFACLFILWHKINSTSQKIEEILALSNNIHNDINRIRETSQIENERIERTIADLSNNINRIHEISQAESESIERNILNLSNNINRIHETTQIENERIERNIADLNNNVNRIRETSQTENERIARTITNLSNNVNRIRETSQAENERIERTITNLNNNVNRMRETFQSESERIERAILDLSDEIYEICEADMNQGLNQFSTTNGANTGQNLNYSNSATLWNVFRSLIDQRIARESRSLNSMFDEITSMINISKSTVYNFYHRKTNPRETTVNEIRRWVNGEVGRNNNLNNLYPILMNA